MSTHRPEPEWVRHAVLWQLHPLTFLGAPAEVDPVAPSEPRLRGLLPWLDYVVELGTNALLLGPVFQSSTHGYDTTDHFRIDTRLGSEDDFQAVLDAAHRRGLRVVLDGVFNHVGRGFGRLKQAESGGAGSEFGSWFRWTRSGELALFEGHEILVTLNHNEPAVVDHVVGVMRHWTGRGVDGWRLDAAYAVPDRFWATVTDRVCQEHPDLWIFGEVIHGDYAARVRTGGLHAVTQYELWKAIWSGLNDRNLFELAHALERHESLLDVFVPQTFIGNHDVTRIATRLRDPRHVGHALVVLMTVAGTPSIYAGDELGWEGLKENRAGGDDAIRPAFPAAPGDVDKGEVFRLHQQLIAVRRRNAWVHDAATEVVHLTNTSLAYVSAWDGHRLAVVLNVSDDPLSVELPAGRWRREAGCAVEGAAQQLTPHSWAVLSS